MAIVGGLESASNLSTCTGRASWDEHLTLCLDNVKNMGEFATMKEYQLAVNPFLQVGDETIPIPLDERGAQSIKKLAQQVPAGDEHTAIANMDIAQVWELNVDQFTLINPAWTSFLDMVLREVCTDLGIIGPVHAQIYKLLLHEKGSGFRPYKDSRKAENVIATLAICLPSHPGLGEFYFSYANQQRKFASESSCFGTTALAWFSDVTYETRKLHSGRSLVLAYNIIHESGLDISAGTFAQQLDEVGHALKLCSLHGHGFESKIYPLDRGYSPAQLSLCNLNGRDSAVCRILHKLCSHHGCYLLLGHMSQDYAKRDGHSNTDKLRRLKLDVINSPDGHRIARDIDAEEGQLLKDLRNNEVEDGFSASRHLGDEESPQMPKRYHSVAIIYSKIGLGSRLYLSGHRFNKTNTMLLVMRGHDENPSTSSTLDVTSALLERIFEPRCFFLIDRGMYGTLIEWAWERGYHSLYVRSVLHSVKWDSNMGEGMTAVAKIINNDISKAKDKTVMQWEKYLGDIITTISNLSLLSDGLTMIENTVVNSLRPAFTTWKTAVERNKFEAKEFLDIGDLSFIMSKLDNSNWSTEYLVPALSERGEKPLLVRVLLGLLKKERDETRTSTIETANNLLRSSYSKVALEPEDFIRGLYFSSTEASLFVTLLERCLVHNLQSASIQLLDAAWVNIDACHKDGTTPLRPYKEKIDTFLWSLLQLLQDHGVLYLHSTRQLFALLIRRYIGSNPPSYPVKRPGWSHKPRGCGCELCVDLDPFLRAENESEYEFHHKVGMLDDLEHIFARLPESVFDRELIYWRGVLRVSKIENREFREDLLDYEKKVAEFEKTFYEYRCGYMKGLLGDSLYREIIMLENVEGSEGAKQLARGSATEGTETENLALEAEPL